MLGSSPGNTVVNKTDFLKILFFIGYITYLRNSYTNTHTHNILIRIVNNMHVQNFSCHKIFKMCF